MSVDGCRQRTRRRRRCLGFHHVVRWVGCHGCNAFCSFQRSRRRPRRRRQVAHTNHAGTAGTATLERCNNVATLNPQPSPTQPHSRSVLALCTDCGSWKLEVAEFSKVISFPVHLFSESRSVLTPPRLPVQGTAPLRNAVVRGVVQGVEFDDTVQYCCQMYFVRALQRK